MKDIAVVRSRQIVAADGWSGSGVGQRQCVFWARSSPEAVQALMSQHGIAGNSGAMLEVFRRTIRFSSSSDLPVLITGESGTGKELLARAIHALDATRQRRAFVAVNCSAINPGLVEAELFGHRRGAFTGAERDRKGLIRAAEGGVLFLDEIGELELGLQAKLLRVLQEHSVLTVGTDQEVPVNVRFIAATNRDLERMVVERKFRRDLFYRLCALPIEIPPLRERPSDLAPLIMHFVRKHHAVDAEARHGSPDFVEALGKLDLPGNARQVENLVCEALMNHEGDGNLSLKDLPSKILRYLDESADQDATASAPSLIETSGSLRHFTAEQTREFMKFILHNADWNLARAMCECERHVVALAMERARGNQCEAARLLGITARSVYRKLHGATPAPLTQVSPSPSSPKADESVRTVLSDPDKIVRSVLTG